MLHVLMNVFIVFHQLLINCSDAHEQNNNTAMSRQGQVMEFMTLHCLCVLYRSEKVSTMFEKTTKQPVFLLFAPGSVHSAALLQIPIKRSAGKVFEHKSLCVLAYAFTYSNTEWKEIGLADWKLNNKCNRVISDSAIINIYNAKLFTPNTNHNIQYVFV